MLTNYSINQYNISLSYPFELPKLQFEGYPGPNKLALHQHIRPSPKKLSSLNKFSYIHYLIDYMA